MATSRRHASGPRGLPSPLFGFLARRGTAWQPVISSDAKEVHQTLCEWLKAQGVTDTKPVHYLRKCYGSLAVGDHGICVASKLLGHSNITLTASTYAGQVDQLPAVKF